VPYSSPIKWEPYRDEHPGNRTFGRMSQSDAKIFLALRDILKSRGETYEFNEINILNFLLPIHRNRTRKKK
jgi:DNA-binding MltR family transcriptional regulator